VLGANVDRLYGDSHFKTLRVDDNVGGSSSLRLQRTRTHEGTTKIVAEVIFWDAAGQFFVETFGEDVPLNVLEELISEAKQTIPIK
jgi:hypothetical protein